MIKAVACPKCKGTNIVPDIRADGSFGAMWCAACDHTFSLLGWHDRLRMIWWGFMIGLAFPLLWLTGRLRHPSNR